MIAEVYLWGTKVGTIWQPEGENARFEYDGEFCRSHVQLAPLQMPLSDKIYSFPELNRVDSFQGLPGLLADSLPDRFGNTVFRAWASLQGKESLSPLERLCQIGRRGMGALEYVPATGTVRGGEKLNVTELSELSSKILSGKEITDLADQERALTQLMEIGSLAGGARAKAVVAWNEETGEVRSGQADAGRGFRDWLIKFDGVSGNGDHGVADPKQFTLTEYAYHLIAKDAGITMEDCRILNKDGRSHFMTRRFDRRDGKKHHVQTLAALGHFDYNVPKCCSYETYANVARRLGMGKEAMEELFRRTAFNFFGVNCDDHVKNFAFLMDRKGNWSLAPAYDLTFAYSPNNRWISAHQMMLCGKTTRVTVEDLMTFGKSLRLSKQFCEKTVGRIADLFDHWMDYAERCQIKEERAEELAKVIQLHKPILNN